MFAAMDPSINKVPVLSESMGGSDGCWQINQSMGWKCLSREVILISIKRAQAEVHTDYWGTIFRGAEELSSTPATGTAEPLPGCLGLCSTDAGTGVERHWPRTFEGRIKHEFLMLLRPRRGHKNGIVTVSFYCVSWRLRLLGERVLVRWVGGRLVG